MRVVLTDGQHHPVDSNDIAFQTAMQHGIRAGVKAGKPHILEPIMNLEAQTPSEFQGTVIGGISKRSGLVVSTELNEDGSLIVIGAEVPLSQMFGYSTDLRSSTQGKGEFSMEYKCHRSVTRDVQETLIKDYLKRYAEDVKND